jgi:hypothetical protein
MDTSKPFGNHIVWTCPNKSSYNVEKLQEVYSIRQQQVLRKEKKKAAAALAKAAGKG